LGRWDKAGGCCVGGGRKITLITRDGKQIAKGKKANKNMYKMFVMVNTTSTTSKKYSTMPKTFLGEEPAIDWETWHWYFGHIGYSGL